MNVVGGGGGLTRMFTLERIGWWSEVTTHEEVTEEFRVELQ